MQFFSVLMFALSASSDAFVVGISYGAKKVEIRLPGIITMSLIAGIGTLAAMLPGNIIGFFIPADSANALGSGLLILFGFLMLISSLKKRASQPGNKKSKDSGISKIQDYDRAFHNPEIVDTNQSNTIEFKEALVLGMLLCLNNVGLGIGASITGLNPYLTSLLSAIFSWAFLYLGYKAGTKLVSAKITQHSDFIAACIVILLGVYELF